VEERIVMRLVQFTSDDGQRRVGAIRDELVIDLTAIAGWQTTLDLARQALATEQSLLELVSVAVESAGSAGIPYETLWQAGADATSRLLLPVDHPDPHHLMVTGTGLTHTGSMQSRDKMHGGDQQATAEAPATDSSRMFQMGIEGGKPAEGERGTAPEWFFKGNGTILRGHRESLELPGFALDGGEEPEIVGCYLVDDEGQPRRLGFTLGNEWSDHENEKINYLYLAPSKLRTCSVGPELLLDCDFQDIDIRCQVCRDGAVIYDSGDLKSGEQYMSHSLANCEDHHFKYPLHRQPGDVHFHYFGTSKLSFSERDWKYRAGDEIEVTGSGFAGGLVNQVVAGSQDQARALTIESL